MSNRRQFTKVLPLTLLAALSANQAKAAVTLMDKDDWKVLMGGFVELDMMNDSTRSFQEVVGDRPVARGNTSSGTNGRTQFSLRNTRLAFTVLPPAVNDWKTKGYMEFDFLGFDTDATTTAPAQSEASYQTNPTLRIRHAYLSAEKDDWQILMGQYWTLFAVHRFQNLSPLASKTIYL